MCPSLGALEEPLPHLPLPLNKTFQERPKCIIAMKMGLQPYSYSIRIGNVSVRKYPYVS